MLAKTHPENEQRLAVLRSLDVLDTGPEKTYDELTKLTAELCEVPVCVISLIEADRQWFKSTVGLGICETPIELSICAHAVHQDRYLEIEDTIEDKRTKDNPLCLGEKPFRFYAGAVLRTLDGWPLGTLCVLDYKARKLSELQHRVLKVHAKSVAQQLELTRALINKAKTIGTRSEISDSTEGHNVFSKKALSRFKSLTPREKEIVRLIAGRSGSLSSKEIARELKISHRTVDHHRANIMTKMNVDSIAELIAVILKAGILR
jgi:DNA-binding CsgD family transcriptional regulator